MPLLSGGPVYRFNALIKLFTAIISWRTIIALKAVLPRALALKSPELLEKEIEQRKEAEDQLQKLNDELESRMYFLAENMPNMVWTAKPDGIISYCNRKWNEFSGLTLEELNNGGWEELIHPDDREASINQWREAMQKGTEYEIEQRFRDKAGNYFWFLTRGSAQTDKDGKILFWVGTNTNIDDQKKITTLLEEKVAARTLELEHLNKELTRSNEELQQFASVASHDLKEPLRKIQTFSDFIAENYGDQLQGARTYFEKIQHASSRMQTLIEDLLTFSRIGSPQNIQKINLNQVVNDVIADLEVQITNKSAIIRVDNLPQIEGSATQIRQLFQNLISNALKFQKKEETPIVEITAEFDSTWNRHKILVKDNGIGFDEKYLDRIFTIFQRLHSRNEYEGTGIGLAVCKKIVEVHNGFLTATSKPGNGAVFIINLPAL